jgi:glycosyltransferase involved in cell wall biosynthesis
MRILFCNYEYPPIGGGGGVVNASLAEELARRHDITVLTSQGMGLPPVDVVNGVRVVRVPVFFRRSYAAANMPSLLAYIPMGVIRGRKLLMKEQFDVINTHFVLPTGPVGDQLARLGNIPNVLSLHGGDLYDPSKGTSPHRHWLLRQWVRRLLRRADCLVGQSKNTVANMQEYFAPDLDAVRIPLGIARPLVPSVRREDYGFADSDKILVTLGRLVSRKAVNQLIDVVRNLNDTNLRLVVIGSGPEEKMLRAQSKEAGLDAQVRFVGQVDEAKKFDLLKLADIFVSTSQHEGFGLVFLEAMAMGTPVVCYDHGGQTDFLEDRKTGGVIPLNDIDKFTDSVRLILADSSMAQSLSANVEKLMEDFFIDTCAERYEQVFEQAIRNHQKQSN